jgi:hypothetical protein
MNQPKKKLSEMTDEELKVLSDSHAAAELQSSAWENIPLNKKQLEEKLFKYYKKQQKEETDAGK